jgi:hypothetical protein
MLEEIMTTEKPKNIQVEFTAPEPTKPASAEPKPGSSAAAPAAEPVVEHKLEIDLAETESMMPTPDEVAIYSRPADDPSALLAEEFKKMPGINVSRAASMAMGAEHALHNLNVDARRALDLARRKAMREAQAQKKRGRRR